MGKSVIQRSALTKIERQTISESIRFSNEVAYATYMGSKPHEVKSLYKDVYEFYQNNEV